jgi:hypothetical protein
MREQRPWIFSLTATISCRRIRQDRVLSEGSRTNFVILINGGDGTQDGFERTKCLCAVLCEVEDNGGTPKYRVLPVHNWKLMLKESERHNGIGTYPSTPPLVRLSHLQCQQCPLLV